MSASDHLQPQQFDELAARRKKKFESILDQVSTFQEQLDAAAATVKPQPRRPRLRLVR